MGLTSEQTCMELLCNLGGSLLHSEMRYDIESVRFLELDLSPVHSLCQSAGLPHKPAHGALCGKWAPAHTGFSFVGYFGSPALSSVSV